MCSVLHRLHKLNFRSNWDPVANCEFLWKAHLFSSLTFYSASSKEVLSPTLYIFLPSNYFPRTPVWPNSGRIFHLD